ncbi:MAG TPA: methyl-accepting chemotaxis protein, partial [Ramlibacter sp.]|nr:methyl-accepting chemotaxis protein [Ramlibacter sp.]
TRVEAGARLVHGAGETMREIVVSVERVSGLVAEIAQACQEQSAGISQINGAITQMEQVVQQNASLVEEAAAATQSMKDDAAVLFTLVSRFRLEAGEDAPWAPMRAAGLAGDAPTSGAAVVALGVSRPLPKLS